VGTANILRSYIVGLAATLTLVGCASIHDCKYETTQRIRVGRAWLHYNIACPGLYSSAFRHGWKAGYYDVLSGNDGCPPLFAPERYSAPCKILNDCDKPRNDWYTGFQSGAACAQNMPDTHYMKPWNPPVSAMPGAHSQLAVPEVPRESIADPDARAGQQSDTGLLEDPPSPVEDRGLELMPPENSNDGELGDSQEASPPDGTPTPKDADTYENDPPKPEPKSVSQIPVLNLGADVASGDKNQVEPGFIVPDANRLFRRSSPWIQTCFPSASAKSVTTTSFEDHGARS